jgi:hypothetical protein
MVMETVKIPLTKGAFALVDVEDAATVSERRWQLHPHGYAYAGIRGRKIFMHRIILGAKTEQEVDHINGDGLDNRRANLRTCTRAENCANQRLSKKNTSGYKGVYFDAFSGRWKAQIQTLRSGKRHLGRFDTAREAALAYDHEARRVFGEFARTNFGGPNVADPI